MLATTASDLPRGEGWIYEPKYDGIRVVAVVYGDDVALLSRNGYDKGDQFPAIRSSLAALGRRRRRRGRGPVVLDGEIVAHDGATAGGPPERARFAAIQPRIHLSTGRGGAEPLPGDAPVFVAFDCLLDGDDVLLSRPWRERRRRMEDVLAGLTPSERQLVRSSTVADGREEGRALLERLRAVGAEGVMAKSADSAYVPGRRSPAWRKLKLELRQELVVGGWTEPRPGGLAREGVGALLVGHYDEQGRLRYAGRVGTGFSQTVARHLVATMRGLERTSSPFFDAADVAGGGAVVRWTEPALVAEVAFSEWTPAGRLRQPVFLGLRDDKPARAVRREAVTGALRPRPGADDGGGGEVPDVATQLARVLAAGGSGVLRVPLGPDGPAGRRAAVPVTVTNLGKPLLPPGNGGRPVTKGDLMAYYAEVAPVLLPAIADRPLVLRRFPNGHDGPAFYQQHAPPSTPPGVRAEVVPTGSPTGARRFVGGDLPTLLHLVQLGAVSVDPWPGRLAQSDDGSLVDYAIVDLDPGPEAPFARVVRVARLVKAELDALGLRSIPKTSGATGLHVVVPLAAGTPAEAARLLAELVATRVAARRPAEATVTRLVARRAPDAVYVDYLQNVRGKTVAAVYSARARPGATVSTPLRWREVGARLDPTAHTIATVPRRIARVGDLWAEAFREPNDLSTLRGPAYAPTPRRSRAR